MSADTLNVEEYVVAAVVGADESLWDPYLPEKPLPGCDSAMVAFGLAERDAEVVVYRRGLVCASS